MRVTPLEGCLPELDALRARNDRLCATRPDVDFFPGRGEDTAEPKALCVVCPAREPCLHWALHHEHYGIWGGTSERERRRLRRGLNIGVNSPQTVTLRTATCGTEGGYQAHWRRHEPGCDACRAAHCETKQRRKQRAKETAA